VKENAVGGFGKEIASKFGVNTFPLNKKDFLCDFLYISFL